MSTYVPIQAITLSADTGTVSFTGIPQTYTDLVLVCSYRDTRAQVYSYPKIRLNSDTGSNYSQTNLYGTGSSALSNRQSSATSVQIYEGVGDSATANIFAPLIIQFMNYTNTTTNKTFLIRGNNTSGASGAVLSAQVGLWRNTSAITSIDILGDTAAKSGSTFTLYGVGSGSPKAFGGDEVRTDGTYWYHIFRSSGRFEPVQALSNVDYLVIAGGGGSGGYWGAGGGAGGYRCSVTGESSGGGASAEPKLSLSANTTYTVTVGAGGPAKSNGSDSIFGSITSTGGGRGGVGGGSATLRQALTGGSGGGGGSSVASGNTLNGASGTTNQGYAGGNSAGASGTYPSAGGGGAGGAGASPANTSSGGGNGGAGITSSITGTAVARAGGGGGGGSSSTSGGTGTAGGGNGGTNNLADGSVVTSGTNGTANTGGGAGGGGPLADTGQSGGSGIVIVRYAV